MSQLITITRAVGNRILYILHVTTRKCRKLSRSCGCRHSVEYEAIIGSVLQIHIIMISATTLKTQQNGAINPHFQSHRILNDQFDVPNSSWPSKSKKIPTGLPNSRFQALLTVSSKQDQNQDLISLNSHLIDPVSWFPNPDSISRKIYAGVNTAVPRILLYFLKEINILQKMTRNFSSVSSYGTSSRASDQW